MHSSRKSRGPGEGGETLRGVFHDLDNSSIQPSGGGWVCNDEIYYGMKWWGGGLKFRLF